MVGHVSLYQLLTNACKSFDGGAGPLVPPCDLPELSPRSRVSFSGCHGGKRQLRERAMNGLIYLVGLIVVILFILSLPGLR